MCPLCPVIKLSIRHSKKTERKSKENCTTAPFRKKKAEGGIGYCGIQFTTHFIEICVVETKSFVGSFVHVILTWQTYGQRSSMAAEIKRRALGNYFFERIGYMFLISKCRVDKTWTSSSPAPYKYLDVPHTTKELRSGSIS